MNLLLFVGLPALLIAGVLITVSMIGNRSTITIDTQGNDSSSEEEDNFTALPGMPEGYTLSKQQIEQKRAMKDGILASFGGMKPGDDYVEDEFIYQAGDESEAKLIAEAYDGELSQFSSGIAVAKIREGSGFSLRDLLRASSDTDNNLPPIEPNLIYHLS